MHSRATMRSTKTVPWFVGLLFVAGCASVPAPSDRIVSARAAIRSASEVGANGVPRASLHLKLATDNFDEADRLMRADDNERANLMLMRAEADAELAIVETRAARGADTARNSDQQLATQRQSAQSTP